MKDDVAQTRALPLPKLAIFDLDGTLIQYHREHYIDITHTQIAKYGYAHLTRQEIADHYSNFDHFGFIPEETRYDFEQYFWDTYMHDPVPHPIVIDGTHDALEFLASNGVLLSIATARPSHADVVKDFLQHSKLTEYVHLLSTKHGATEKWYDKTQQLMTVCNHFKIAPENTVMVGDTPPDIWSAKKIGISQTVAVLSGGIFEEVLKKEEPSHIVPDVGHIPMLYK